jgi:hypothetical protein
VQVNAIRTEEEYFRILRDRIIECICQKILRNKMTTFHGVDMVRDCARGFLDEKGVDRFQFSGEHEYYKHVLERVFRPLVGLRLMAEYENNNFSVPDDSRLRDICRKELSNKSYIKWDDFLRTVQSSRGQ